MYIESSMVPSRSYLAATLCALVVIVSDASAVTVEGTVEPAIPSGQFISLTMTIDDTKTTFELTGPDYSWFALGFDTKTMFGYSLIVEGTDGNRTAVEQNLQGVAAPGSPQASQDISIISTIHDAANDLTTIVIERPNNTGDADDAVFSPSMTELDIIGAYDSFSSPSSPNGFLSYHGQGGRGFGKITFFVVPEPTTFWYVALAASLKLFGFRRRRNGCTFAKCL
jgi:hypothetical protein